MIRILAIAAVLAFASDARAQTEVGGSIRSNTVWSGGTYVVSRDVTVSEGAVLRIESGTIVEFGYDDTIFVRDGAEIEADGAIFRPKSTLGTSAAFYAHEVASPGSVTFNRCTFEHVAVYTSGSGRVEITDSRFEGEAQLRLFSSAGVHVLRNTFESPRPILSEISLPSSEIASNVFAEGSVIFHPDAQRITGTDTLRSYQGLPIQIDNDVSITGGGRLVLAHGVEIRQGYFNSFLVNGGATLVAAGVHFRPVGTGNFPAIIVSQGGGAGRAEITESVVEALSLQFSGGTGSISRTDFLVPRGRTALQNTGSTPIEARNNFWNGEAGPVTAGNPLGNGASISGPAEIEPWLAARAGGVSTSIEAELPAGGLEIESIYPNPVATSARIRIHLSEPGTLEIRVYDAVGRLVREKHPGYVPAGSQEYAVDAGGLAAGFYFLRLETEGTSRTRPFVVAR